MKNSFLEILSCVIISWSGKHLDWLESLLGTTDGQALVRGSFFFVSRNILSHPFFLFFVAKNILHALCLVSCQLIFTFSLATQIYWSLLLQFSSFFCLRKEIKFWKVEIQTTMTKSTSSEWTLFWRELGVDEDSGRSGRSKLARRREARIAQDHGIGNRFFLLWIGSEWFSGEAYPPFDPARGPKKDFSLLIGVPDSKSRHKMLSLTWSKHCNGCPWKYHQALCFIVWCIIESLLTPLQPFAFVDRKLGICLTFRPCFSLFVENTQLFFFSFLTKSLLDGHCRHMNRMHILTYQAIIPYWILPFTKNRLFSHSSNLRAKRSFWITFHMGSFPPKECFLRPDFCPFLTKEIEFWLSHNYRHGWCLCGAVLTSFYFSLASVSWVVVYYPPSL